MSEKMIQIAENADMIVDGYAFTGYESGCRVIDLNDPVNAMVISGDDEVIETTMDDIEISIVLDLYKRNKENYKTCTENGKQRAIRAFLENRVFWIF